MKIYHLLVLVVPLCLTSCVSFQYMTITSNLQKSEQNNYIVDNDSLRITYQFEGLNCPMKVEIENKTSDPLYVDWSRSSIIVQGDATPYWHDEKILNAESSGSTVDVDRDVYISSHTINGTITGKQVLGFIPPKASISTPVRTIQQAKINHTNKKLIRLRSQTNPTYVTKLYESEYTYENSPVKFRSYITLSRAKEITSPVVIDSEFWISRMYSSSQRLQRSYFSDPVNTFHVTDATGVGTGLAVGAVAGLLVLQAANHNNAQGD